MSEPATAPSPVDSHQHFWRVSRGDYAWMGDHVAPLLRDFLPGDLRPHLERAGIGRTVLVQAAETVAETEFLLGLARETDFVAGVVGWLDFDADDFPERLRHFRADPLLVGLRPMLQDHPDDRFILRPRVLRHLATLAEADLPLDLLVHPRHLPHARKALEAVPGLRAVVDHLAKPPIAAGTLDSWQGEIAAIARLPQVMCKVSGMVTEASGDWTAEELRPFVDHVAAAFGEDRLMFGSDWPVATLKASYEAVWDAARELLGRHFDEQGMAKVLGGNAARFYGLDGRKAGA